MHLITPLAVWAMLNVGGRRNRGLPGGSLPSVGGVPLLPDPTKVSVLVTIPVPWQVSDNRGVD